MIKNKCQAKDCDRIIEHPEKSERWFCSFECACYAGEYDVIRGWSKDDKPLRQLSIDYLSGKMELDNFLTQAKPHVNHGTCIGNTIELSLRDKVSEDEFRKNLIKVLGRTKRSGDSEYNES